MSKSFYSLLTPSERMRTLVPLWAATGLGIPLVIVACILLSPWFALFFLPLGLDVVWAVRNVLRVSDKILDENRIKHE